MTLNQTKPIHLNHGKSKTKLERVGGHIAGTRRSFLNNYHPILLLGRGTTTVCAPYQTVSNCITKGR